MIKNINYKSSFPKKYYKKNEEKKLLASFKREYKKILENVDKPDSIFYMLNKKFHFNFKQKELGQFKKYKNIIIIGMGGSILGAETIYQFLKKKIKKNVTFLDNIDFEKIETLKKKINNKDYLFLVISKSGNTVETISNLFYLNIIKKKSKNIIIISEKNNNFLLSIAKKYNLFFIEHKNYIGGRYSVLSEVGMIPAIMLGANIQNIRKNISKHLLANQQDILKNNVIKLASFIKKKKYKNIIFFNYAPELENLLFWCQQLIAESLGKNGKGFLPIISNAPKDHLSLLQLYLDGPKDKIFYVFSLEKKIKNKLKTKKIIKEKNYLNNKSLMDIKKAQKEAFIKILKINKIPFREFTFNNLNEETLGEIFSYFILETVLVAKVTKTNPFDQPAVEDVKILTKKILNKVSK